MKNKIAKYWFSSTLCTTFLFFFPKISLAAVEAGNSIVDNSTNAGHVGENFDGASAAYDFLTSNTEYVQLSDFIKWVFHSLGWMIIKGLYYMARGLEGFIDKVFEMFNVGGAVSNLFGIDGLDNAYRNIAIVGFSILLIVLIIFGIKVMVSDKVSIQNTVLNVMLSMFLIFSAGYLVQTSMQSGKFFYDGSKNMFNSSYQTNSEDTFSLRILNNNTVDLYRLSKATEKSDLTKLKNKEHSTDYIRPNANGVKAFNTSQDFLNANLADILKDNKKATWDKIGEKNKELLSYRVESLDGDKKDKVVKLKDNLIFKWFDEGYFRYGFKFSNILIEMLVYMVAVLMTVFLLVRHMFNMIFTYTLIPLITPMDINSGSKTKRIVGDIIKGGAAIGCTGIAFSLFINIFNRVMEYDGNILFKLIVMIATAIACWDGAEAFNKYFDYDTGFKSGWRGLMAGAYGAKMAGGVASGVASAGSAMASGVNAMKSAVADKFGEFSNTSDNVASGFSKNEDQPDATSAVNDMDNDKENDLSNPYMNQDNDNMNLQNNDIQDNSEDGIVNEDGDTQNISDENADINSDLNAENSDENLADIDNDTMENSDIEMSSDDMNEIDTDINSDINEDSVNEVDNDMNEDISNQEDSNMNNDEFNTMDENVDNNNIENINADSDENVSVNNSEFEQVEMENSESDLTADDVENPSSVNIENDSIPDPINNQSLEDNSSLGTESSQLGSSTEINNNEMDEINSSTSSMNSQHNSNSVNNSEFDSNMSMNNNSNIQNKTTTNSNLSASMINPKTGTYQASPTLLQDMLNQNSHVTMNSSGVNSKNGELSD